MRLPSWIRRTLLGGGSILVILVALSLVPVPAATPENCDIVTGIVYDVDSYCCEDFHVRLEDDSRVYYVNRGVELGLDPASLRESMVGQSVDLYVIRTWWSPLNPRRETAPLARIEMAGTVIHSAF